MLKEVKMYTVVCDNCAKDVNKDAEYSAWNDKRHAEEVAMEAVNDGEGEIDYEPLGICEITPQ